jgi:glycosyltransferase involved in cell wall biosynthesis
MLARWSLRRSRWKKRLYGALIENRNLRSAAAFHFFRDQELEDARAAGVRSPCFVLPNGIDAALLEAPPSADRFVERYPETRDRVRLLFLGRLHPVKGLDLLIPAFSAARRSFPDLHLILVGPDEGGYRATVEKQIQEVGLDGAVTLTGMLTGERKREALGAADFFVLPSYQEADSMAVKEAMAAGLPVVISDAHRFDEVAAAGAGIIVPCKREPLAEALLVLARDARLRATMGQAARRLIRSRYTWDRITEDLERVYTELVDGTRTCGMWR